MYRERVGCIAEKIVLDDVLKNGQRRAQIRFVLNWKDRWTRRDLHTSPVSSVEERDGKLGLHTHNSIYVFEEAVLPEPQYLDMANVLELYLDDYGFHFFKGFYYDDEKQPHELDCSINLGLFEDTCLIYQVDGKKDFLCRYLLRDDMMEFYDAIYGQQDHPCPILIHNTGEQDLRVFFLGEEIVVGVGEEKWINSIK